MLSRIVRPASQKPGSVMSMPIRFTSSSGRVDPRKLRTIARLGGDTYCRTSDLFEMKRPE